LLPVHYKDNQSIANDDTTDEIFPRLHRPLAEAA
jgi:hypothetical protein